MFCEWVRPNILWLKKVVSEERKMLNQNIRTLSCYMSIKCATHCCTFNSKTTCSTQTTATHRNVIVSFSTMKMGECNIFVSYDLLGSNPCFCEIPKTFQLIFLQKEFILKCDISQARESKTQQPPVTYMHDSSDLIYSQNMLQHSSFCVKENALPDTNSKSSHVEAN